MDHGNSISRQMVTTAGEPVQGSGAGVWVADVTCRVRQPYERTTVMVEVNLGSFLIDTGLWYLLDGRLCARVDAFLRRISISTCM